MVNPNSMSIEVHNKSSVYMPITKSFVNLRLDTQDIDNALRNPLEYVARCFGYGGSSMSSFSQEEIKRLRNFRDSILKNTDVDQDTLKTILRGAEKELVDAGIMDHLDHEEKEPDLERIQSLFQDDVGKYILRKLALDNAELNTVESRGMITRKLSDMGGVEFSTARSMGFKDVIYIEDFPMAVVNAGYKRAHSIDDLDDSDLRMHPTNPDGKVQIFSETYSTEGILFLMDPTRILDWIEHWTGNPLNLDPDIPFALPLAALTTGHQYNIRNCDQVFGERGVIEEPVGHNIFTLMHSLSHASILACSIKSGFHANTLSEHLTPGCLGFYVYVNKMYQKGLGGLENLFTGDMMGLLNRIRENSLDCIHDPHCWNSVGSACHACIVLSETSCREFNSHLDRKVIHGGQVGSTSKDGYLDYSGGNR